MEFSPADSMLPRYKALIEYLLGKTYQIDEKEIHDPKLAQEVFLLKHQKELSKNTEKRLVPKVLKDIDFILKRSWAKKISKDDFNHVHICGVSKTPIFDLDRLFSEENIRLIYHTLETPFLTPDHTNRNIVSSLKMPPVVMPIHLNYQKIGHSYLFFNNPQIGISCDDVGLKEYGKIEFAENQNGPYKLENGTRLEMRGILSNCLINHIKVNTQTGIIEFNGKTIGKAKKS